ncbi:MAG TPA: EutN/CcmL family microcompartment protein [Lacunisphaera sp.]|nr:EutN/CcmL family microcompartment protein [Lacunisphaera sp.]
MNLARVDGTMVASVGHSSLAGRRSVICQLIDENGRDEGAPILAIDPLGAGLHERVILSTDGAATRALVGDPHTPLRNLIIGLVDRQAS